MLDAPVYIFSDTHLGAAPPRVETALLEFLRAVRRDAGSLLINGDLFDFWFEWRTVVPRRSFRVLSALADLVDDGMKVLLIAGNHDCWGGEVLREDVGITYHSGAWEGSIAGWRARVEHGDGLRPKEDRGYRMLRKVLRHPASIAAFKLLHPDLGTGIANRMSHTSRRYRALDEGAGIRRIAMNRLAQDRNTELLLFGHSHVAHLERSPGGGVYANAGSWLDEPTFLVVTPERIELRRWRGSAEGDRLDAVDRGAQKATAQL